MKGISRIESRFKKIVQCLMGDENTKSHHHIIYPSSIQHQIDVQFVEDVLHSNLLTPSKIKFTANHVCWTADNENWNFLTSISQCSHKNLRFMRIQFHFHFIYAMTKDQSSSSVSTLTTQSALSAFIAYSSLHFFPHTKLASSLSLLL